MKNRNHSILILLLGALILLAPLGMGEPVQLPPLQDDPVLNAQVQGLNIEKIKTRINEIEANAEIEDSVKNPVLDLYRQAKSRIEAAEQYRANGEEFKNSIEEDPAETEKIRQSIEDLKARMETQKIEVSGETELKDLEAALTRYQAEQAELKRRISEYDSQIKLEKDRPASARQQLSEAKTRLDEIEKDLKVIQAQSGNGEHPLLSETKRILLEARKQARLAESAMIEQELLSHGARLEKNMTMREFASLQLPAYEERILKHQQLINEKKKIEAEAAKRNAEQAEREALGKHPAISELAKENADLGRELELTVKETEKESERCRSTRQLLEKIEKEFSDARQQVDKVGLNRVLGEVLRNQRGQLPQVKKYRNRAEDRKERVAEANFKVFFLDDLLEDLRDSESILAGIMAEKVDPALPESRRKRIEAEVAQLLSNKKDLLSKLSDAYNDLVNELGTLEFTENLLMENVTTYGEFLDQRLLWIPSNDWLTFTRERLQGFIKATAWLFNPLAWVETGIFLTRGAALVWTILSFVTFAVILLLNPRFKKGLASISEKVGKVYVDSFFLTIKALFYTTLLAAPGPLFMLFIASILHAFPSTEFSSAVSAGLKPTAILFFAIQFLWYLCHEKGVAVVHFRWIENTTRVMRRHLLWLMPVLLPVIFIVYAMEYQLSELYKDSLGRVVFIVGMVAFGIFCQRVLRPNGGITETYIKANPNGWLSRLSILWCPAAVMVPLALAVLSVLGFHYSALQLKGSLFATIFLAIGVMIVHDLILRWFLVAQRRLALAKARERREAAKAERQEPEEDDDTQVTLDIPEINLSTINEQSRHLLRVLAGLTVILGFWWIWADELPALGIFEQIELWSYSVDEGGESRQIPVTLASLISALIVFVMTMVATRNIPGVMEIAVLRHLPFDPGSRYAITTVSRYAIIGIGLIVALNILGFSWSSLQWLVAALSVGIGFGLQEIVANFISGLILLFERPIRVGDTVTVAGVSGTVSRIRIRATTITDWDRKELIIPNKAFITGELVNWTLSDPITRLILPVGIAYGSDTALAQKVLETVVSENPLVLDEPKPRVLFMSFGDSSLNFEARVFVRGITNMITVRHELHAAIDNAFRKHDIEISFPQRDIHVRSIKAPLDIKEGNDE